MLMDTLIDIQYSRMKLIENDFVSSITALEEEFGEEREDIIANHAKHRADMLSLLAAMDEEFKAAEAAAQAEFEAARDEITSANQEEYHVAKLTLEQAINELEATFDAAHQAYVASTDTRAQSFQQLTKQDAAAARTIERRARKLARLTDALTHWRAKLLSNTRSWEERNRLLRAEKDSVIKHYGELRDRMMRLRNAEAGKLKTMVLASGACVKTLEERLQLAEKILKLSDLNSKMETEMEAALPLYDGSTPLGELSEDEKAALKVAGLAAGAAAPEEPPSQFSSWGADEEGNPVSEWDYLNRFFQRHNKVELDMAAVERERLRLAAENGDLRVALKRFLDGLAVNDDVMRDQENSLLVVRARRAPAFSSMHAAGSPVVDFGLLALGMRAVHSLAETAKILRWCFFLHGSELLLSSLSACAVRRRSARGRCTPQRTGRSSGRRTRRRCSCSSGSTCGRS